MAPSLHNLSGHQRCLACWSQGRDRTYLQFGVFDGPLEDMGKGRTPYAHDDVILCDRCVVTGLDLTPERQSKVDAALKSRDAAQRQLGDLREYCGKLEKALATRPEAMSVPEEPQATADAEPEKPPAPKEAPAKRASTRARSSKKMKESES